jgi:hypothetical protein
MRCAWPDRGGVSFSRRSPAAIGERRPGGLPMHNLSRTRFPGAALIASLGRARAVVGLSRPNATERRSCANAALIAVVRPARCHEAGLEATAPFGPKTASGSAACDNAGVSTRPGYRALFAHDARFDGDSSWACECTIAGRYAPTPHRHNCRFFLRLRRRRARLSPVPALLPGACAGVRRSRR